MLQHVYDPLAGSAGHVAHPPTGNPSDLSLLESVNGFVFAPLISDKLALLAEISITMLRPERPGQIVQQTGDIDNRLKTLFDALSVPPYPEHIPRNFVPRGDQVPLYCLLQDDRLISSVAVRTERLLTHDDSVNTSHVVLLIHVKTRVTRHMYASIPFL